MEILTDSHYVKAYGIHYLGALSKIAKSADKLQPVYEAFTNSLEAIKLGSPKSKGAVKVQLYHSLDLLGGRRLDKIVVQDSGIGFNEAEYERLVHLNDTRKGFNNKGSGRVQFLHFFNQAEYISIFSDPTSSTGFRQRSFVLSKSQAFMRNNAIIRHDLLAEVKASAPTTILTFKSLLSEKDQKTYDELTIFELKSLLINRYLAYFCENRDLLPLLVIEQFIDNNLTSNVKIESQDIPSIDKQIDTNVFYTRMSHDGKAVEKSANSEKINVKGFKISKENLPKNALKITSKGEIAKELRLESLLVDDEIGGYRYLFLISGKFIDERDTDTRGNLNIPTLDEFKKKFDEQPLLFTEEEIVMDDIRDTANSNILILYQEISDRLKEKERDVEKLQKMFLLNYTSIREAKIKLNDSDEDILEKVYKADAKIAAKKDAEIKKRVDNLNTLNPASKDFQKRFLEEVSELARAIPLQNRAQLTHYVARRKLVLDLFSKILNRELEIQKSTTSNFDESYLHNLLFKKGSEQTGNSDLWIINEDFIYFSGVSEKQLSKVEIDGKLLFKNEFTIEENRYLKSLGENRKIKRPDVLLFPEEGKCIIIEFKSPNVNASEHLTQIDLYANLIRNYTNDEFQITTFFGYLIGENIELRDVLGRVSRYEHSYHFDYLFRPSENVIGFEERANGSIYTEVIKYTTLLERAKRRNNIFIDKL